MAKAHKESIFVRQIPLVRSSQDLEVNLMSLVDQ